MQESILREEISDNQINGIQPKNYRSAFFENDTDREDY